MCFDNIRGFIVIDAVWGGRGGELGNWKWESQQTIMYWKYKKVRKYPYIAYFHVMKCSYLLKMQ